MGYKEKKDSDASIQGTLIRELIGRFTSYHLIGKKIKNGEFQKPQTQPKVHFSQHLVTRRCFRRKSI